MPVRRNDDGTRVDAIGAVDDSTVGVVFRRHQRHGRCVLPLVAAPHGMGYNARRDG